MTNEKIKMEELTVEQLEAQILSYRAAERDEHLEALLFARQRKINDAFEWTPENMEKLLHLNQKLMNCFEKLRNEAIPIVAALEHYLSYAIHVLVDHTCWSAYDILRINHLWSELCMVHQNFENVAINK